MYIAEITALTGFVFALGFIAYEFLFGDKEEAKGLAVASVVGILGGYTLLKLLGV